MIFPRARVAGPAVAAGALACLLATGGRAVTARAPLAALAQTPPAASGCADTTAVVARASGFVHELGEALGGVIADEDYRQELVGAVDETPQAIPPPITIVGTVRVQPAAPMTKRTGEVRTLKSSFLFVRLPAEETWVGFRDVDKVNGKAVGGKKAPLEVNGETSLDRWKRLSDDSARYNVGSITRTLNVPTFALIVLHRSNLSRFTFTTVPAAPETRAPGSEVRQTCVVAFEETASPTIVRSAVGADLPSSGTFRIDVATGRVLQSELVTGSTQAGVGSTSTVRYELDRRLGLSLPVEMREDYRTKWGERVLGVARYSGYRKTTVTTAIRPAP